MKRLFVVFVTVMMLFFVGCQSASMVNAGLAKGKESIFSINDESITNAGILTTENEKDGSYIRNGIDGENGAGITAANGNGSDNLVTQLTEDTLINTEKETSKDKPDENDSTDVINDKCSKDEIDSKYAYPELDQSTTSEDNNNNPILVIQHNDDSQYHENSNSSSIWSASQEEYSSHGIAGSVPCSNECPDHSSLQSESQENTSQETTSEVPSNNETTPDETKDSSDTNSSSQEECYQETDSDAQSNHDTSSDESPLKIELNDNGFATLVSYTGTDSVVDLSNEHFHIVGENAFMEKELITTVILPDSVNEIGMGAFEGCTNLTTLKMPPSIKLIGARAFMGTKLSGSLELHAPEISIGDSAFAKTLISEIILKNDTGVALTVHPYAFAECPSLSKIVMTDFNSSLTLFDNAFCNVSILNVYIKNPGFRVMYKSQYTKTALGISDEINFLDPKTLPIS